MNHTQTYGHVGFPIRNPFILMGFLVVCILLTVLIDFMESRFQNSGFFISESLLFSSFWWIFLPFWYLQLIFVESSKTKIRFAFLVFLPGIIHLIAFPVMVWLVSGFFFNHTFGFGQTFQFAITHHFFKVFLLYTIPIGLYAFFQKRLIFFQKVNASKSTESTETMTSLSVKEGSKQFYIPVKEVLYFSANPPYVDVYHKGKKHLFNITLKSLLEKLDSGIFVRIHKSEIVNLSHVESYKSRQNGDYDVTMIDGTVLRMSRNFAKDFKAKLEILTQDKI